MNESFPALEGPRDVCKTLPGPRSFQRGGTSQALSMYNSRNSTTVTGNNSTGKLFHWEEVGVRTEA